jgi:hypothetical protein
MWGFSFIIVSHLGKRVEEWRCVQLDFNLCEMKLTPIKTHFASKVAMFEQCFTLSINNDKAQKYTS